MLQNFTHHNTTTEEKEEEMVSMKTLVKPTEFTPCEHLSLERSTLEIHTSHKSNDTFLLKERSYSKQFAPMYYNRLKQLRPRVAHSATRKWGKEHVNGKPVTKRDKVLDIRPDEPSWIIGTVYMEMKYKPNILDEVSKGLDVSITAIESYVDQDLDEIMLEDESGRILLEGDLLKQTVLATGVVIGVLGMETKPGCFKVVDIVYPLMSAIKPARSSKGKIAICSGLEFSGVWDSKHDLLIDYLTGELGYDSHDIARLIIAGNSVHVTEDDQRQQDPKNRYGAKNKSNYSPQSLIQLDSFLNSLLSSIPVDILPGVSDPAEISLPQQPLHRAFFKNSASYLNSTHFRRLTNPYWFQFNELRLLGTSGENINDIYKYTVPDALEISRVEMIEATLHWQNIIPTAPDTLSCYPFIDNDPFTLTETPHVYFVGNQPSFETKLLQLERGDVRIIGVPSFNKTGEIVILDTDTLETSVVSVCP
jgi:DNA polymerase delta subunit 2